MSVIMEMGLIHPPVGLNIFVINNIAPDIPLKDVVWGTLPFVFLIMFAVFLLCLFPQLVLGMPDYVFGAVSSRAS